MTVFFNENDIFDLNVDVCFGLVHVHADQSILACSRLLHTTCARAHAQADQSILVLARTRMLIHACSTAKLCHVHAEADQFTRVLVRICAR